MTPDLRISPPCWKCPGTLKFGLPPHSHTHTHTQHIYIHINRYVDTVYADHRRFSPPREALGRTVLRVASGGSPAQTAGSSASPPEASRSGMPGSCRTAVAHKKSNNKKQTNKQPTTNKKQTCNKNQSKIDVRGCGRVPARREEGQIHLQHGEKRTARRRRDLDTFETPAAVASRLGGPVWSGSVRSHYTLRKQTTVDDSYRQLSRDYIQVPPYTSTLDDS